MAKHVLLVHQNFVSGKQAGNARAIHMVAGLLRAGFRVDVITGSHSYLEEGKQEQPVRVEQDGGLKITRLGDTKASLAGRGKSYLRFLLGALRQARAEPHVDVLYATSPPLPQLLLSMAISCRRNAPMLLEIRDVWPGSLVDVGLLQSRLMIMAMEWIESAAYRYCDHCVPVSPPFTAYLERMGLCRRDMTIVPTGGDPAYADPDREAAKRWARQHGLEGKFFVAYGGSFNEHYGIERMTAAALQLSNKRPDIHWVFAGNGRRRSCVEDAARQHENIHYLGSLPRDEIRYLLWSAGVTLVSLIERPHMETVIPGKLLDALAAGVPVISLIDGQAGQILRASGGGLVCEPTTKSLCQAVEQMADMTESDRNALRQNGQKWIHTHMDAAQMADCLADAMQRVTNTPPRNRWVRLLLAGIGATADVLVGRAKRAERAVFGSTRQETIETCFHHWLDERKPSA